PARRVAEEAPGRAPPVGIAVRGDRAADRYRPPPVPRAPIAPRPPRAARRPGRAVAHREARLADPAEVDRPALEGFADPLDRVRDRGLPEFALGPADLDGHLEPVLARRPAEPDVDAGDDEVRRVRALERLL